MRLINLNKRLIQLIKHQPIQFMNYDSPVRSLQVKYDTSTAPKTNCCETYEVFKARDGQKQKQKQSFIHLGGQPQDASRVEVDKFSPLTYKKDKKPTEAMSNLKCELATLKEQISKLMVLEGKYGKEERRLSATANVRLDRSRQGANMTQSHLYIPSLDLSILRPIDQDLTADKVHQTILENQTLKMELKNLKNKYISKKSELKDEIFCLNQKIHHLEGIVCHSTPFHSLSSSRTDLTVTTPAGLLKEQMQKIKQSCQSCQDLKMELKKAKQENVAARDYELKVLKEDHHRKEQQLNQLIRKLQSLKDSHNQMMTDSHQSLNRLKQEIDKLNTQLQDTKAANEQKAALLDQLNDQVYMSRAKIQEQTKVIKHQQQEIGNFVANSHHVSNSQITLRCQMDQLKKELSDRKFELANQTHQYDAFKIELEMKLAEANRQAQQSSNEIENYRNTIKALEKANVALHNTIHSLSSQLESSKTGHDKMQSLSEELQRTTNYFEEKIMNLTMQHIRQTEQLKQESVQLKIANRNATTQVEQLTAAIGSKDKELANAKLELQKSKKNVEEATTCSRKASDDYQELEQHLEVMTKEMKNLKSIRNVLQNQISSMRQENRNLGEQLYHFQSLSSRSENQQSTISKLQLKLTSLEKQLENSNKKVVQNASELQSLQRLLRQKDTYLLASRQENQALQQALHTKEHEFNEERERWRRAERHTEQSKLIEHLSEQLKKQAQSYDEIIRDLKMELQFRSKEDLTQSRSSIGDLDQALKGHNDQLSLIRDNLKQRTQEVQRLKDALVKTKSQYDNLKSLYDIEKVKSLSEKNNTTNNKDIQIQNLKNDLNLAQKTKESALQKIKYLNDENKKKDGFIQSYLLGKKPSPQQQLDIKAFFAAFDKQFPRETIHENLFRQMRQIQRLEQANRQLSGLLKPN